MVDWKKESVSQAVVIFAVFAAVVMLVSVFGVGIFLTPRSVGSSENVSLHTLDPNYTSTGYYLFSDPNNSVTVVNANLSGNLKNDSSMESYTESVVNNNVTVTIKSDPIYFNFDPGVYQRSFWWGYRFCL